MLPDPARFFITALNHLLNQADWARQRLLLFAGRSAAITLPPWQIRFTIDEHGLVAPPVDDVAADVTVSLPADTPWRVLQGDLEPIMASAHVSGNAEFATELAFVFRHLRWDVEEDLAAVLGDVAAHRLAGTIARMALWQRQAVGNFFTNLAEYLSLESAALVPKQELGEFSTTLSRFTTSLQQCEQRLDKLGPKLPSR